MDRFYPRKFRGLLFEHFHNAILTVIQRRSPKDKIKSFNEDESNISRTSSKNTEQFYDGDFGLSESNKLLFF